MAFDLLKIKSMFEPIKAIFKVTRIYFFDRVFMIKCNFFVEFYAEQDHGHMLFLIENDL